MHTTKALKIAARKQKNPSQRGRKKLKVDEETSQASPLESGNSSMETPSTSTTWEDVCKKEESEDDFTFDQSPLKRVKTEACPQGKPVKFPEGANSIKEEVEMNWDIVQVSAVLHHLCAVSPGQAHRLCSLREVLAVLNSLIQFASDFWNQALDTVSTLGYTVLQSGLSTAALLLRTTSVKKDGCPGMFYHGVGISHQQMEALKTHC